MRGKYFIKDISGHFARKSDLVNKKRNGRLFQFIGIYQTKNPFRILYFIIDLRFCQ